MSRYRSSGQGAEVGYIQELTDVELDFLGLHLAGDYDNNND